MPAEAEQMRKAGMRALITGASRGIGKAIALKFASEPQSRLALVYRSDEAAATEVAEGCRARGASVVLIQADLGDAGSGADCIKRSVDAYGGLDVLVNNAGITADGLTVRMSDEAWRKVIQVNLEGTFFICRSAAKVMMKQRYGRIINLSSVSARRPNRGQVNYAASKGGIEAMTRALAVELGSRGITVNAVAPGIIETEMSERIREHATKELLSAIPANRFGQAPEVAELVLFLSRESSGYITGQTIGIDGGLGL